MGFGRALLVIAAGVASFLYGGTIQATDPLALPLVAAGGALVLAGLVLLVLAWRASGRRAYAEAAAATDAVARWQVYPSDMAAFGAVDEARSGRLWSLANALKLPSPVPPEGFPVVVGEKTLLIGEKYYDLGLAQFGVPGEVAWHEGNPGFIEVSLELETTKAPLIVILRIPVPASARQEAARAFAHFQSQIQPRDRERLHARFPDHFEAAAQAGDTPHRLQRRRPYVLAAIAVFCLAMLAIVFLPRL
jgi:hypothetical protein